MSIDSVDHVMKLFGRGRDTNSMWPCLCMLVGCSFLCTPVVLGATTARAPSRTSRLIDAIAPGAQSTKLSLRQQDLAHQASEGGIAGQSHRKTDRDRLESIEPDDFWGVRDLLLISYAGVFMVQNSIGHQLVQAYVLDFAGMLPKLHPYSPCRISIGTVLAHAPSGRFASDEENKQRLLAVAEAAWSCLPAKFTVDSFSNPYRVDMMGNLEASFGAHMTVPVNTSGLGACQDSRWPRTCSYWATMHAMAKRADAIGVGDRLISSFVSMAAAGATLCAGCTFHWQALHKDFLDQRILQDFGSSF